MAPSPEAPDPESARLAARVAGIELDAAQAEEVSTAIARTWESLTELRERDWSFADGIVEPAHGDAWLRRWSAPEKG